ncbi:zinc ribbon domain-containing protein [Hydrogenophaga sp. 5NK40-0174]|uniref:zinc ribbon domain-containing protein n=1 Tax=Hydrogenophaga sp. 5NK40-0174 TaxID=3127649 RepID=UPI003106FD1A
MREEELAAKEKLSCPACGGEAHWNPAKKALICAYCGTESPYELVEEGEIVEHDLVTALREVPSSARGWEAERRAVKCQHCDAISVFSAEQQGSRCDFCGSSALVPFEETDDIIRPQALLPFDVSESRARDLVRQWYGSRWWAPNNLSKRALTDTLKGVYLPYWTFDAQASASYTAEAGEPYQDSEGKRRVRWYPVSGYVEHFFDDTLVCGSRGVHPRLVQAVEPFPTTDKLKSYDAGYLSGWTVERYQLDLVASAERGRQRMREGLRQLCSQDIGNPLQRGLRMDDSFSGQTFKHILLPIWLVGYDYGRKDYQVVVNGVTGKVAGEHPISWVKVALAVLAAIIALVIYASVSR